MQNTTNPYEPPDEGHNEPADPTRSRHSDAVQGILAVVALALIGATLAPAVSSAPQARYEIPYAVTGGLIGLALWLVMRLSTHSRR